MYYLLLMLLYPVSLLPFPVLYMLSDVGYVIVYYMVRYRRDVTADNLRHAYPEKSEAELKQVEKRFYRSFCDQWLEMIKLLTISKAELNRRMPGNWEVFQRLLYEGRDVYILLGHTFNWEWANVAMQLKTHAQFAGVYNPVSNKAMDRLMLRLRTRGGGWMISMKNPRGFQRLKDMRHIVGLISDQNPSNMNGALWLPFMHREAPFYKGPEMLARRAGAAVVFMGLTKLRRGYYNVDVTVMAEDARQAKDQELTRAFVANLEAQLYIQPENWLWTHKRWKHKRDASAAQGSAVL